MFSCTLFIVKTFGVGSTFKRGFVQGKCIGCVQNSSDNSLWLCLMPNVPPIYCGLTSIANCNPHASMGATRGTYKCSNCFFCGARQSATGLQLAPPPRNPAKMSRAKRSGCCTLHISRCAVIAASSSSVPANRVIFTRDVSKDGSDIPKFGQSRALCRLARDSEAELSVHLEHYNHWNYRVRVSCVGDMRAVVEEDARARPFYVGGGEGKEMRRR